MTSSGSALSSQLRVTLPVTVFDLLLDDPAERALVRDRAVDVGAGREVPLDALADVHPELGVVAAEFFRRARRLWERRAVGEALGPEAVLVRVPLVDVRQVDSKDGRVDLTAESRALEQTPQTRELSSLLDASPHWPTIRRSGSLTRVKDRSTLTAALSGPLWPLELGGPPCPGELRRELLLEVSHAAWRDRRSRRLVRLAAVALEVWPDPEPLRTRLRAPL